MKKAFIIILIAIWHFPAFSQNYQTGNTELDASLRIINTNATSDPMAFRTQLKLDFQISDGKLDYMSVQLKMSPAEIYFSLEIGKYSRLTIDQILVIYQKNKNKGWGVIAKECGIKPGSEEFHKIKANAGNKAKKSKDNPVNGNSKKNKQNQGNDNKGKGKKGGK